MENNERLICRICNNDSENQTFIFKEMMFGTKEEFPYFLCSKCGCLQILHVPADLSKYYPRGYYSYNLAPSYIPKSKIKFLAKKFVYMLLSAKFHPIKQVLAFLLSRFKDYFIYATKTINLSRSMKILDVGCGDGTMLNMIKTLGYSNALGIDPFYESNNRYPSGLSVIKRDFLTIRSKWDLIIFHHSFEHVPNPMEILQHISDTLSNNGCCIIFIPTTSSFAWEKYGVDWVQIDAPRHLHLFSIKSMLMIARKAGLSVVEIGYDSTAFQFWGSEQYRNDVPLNAKNSYTVNPTHSLFRKEQVSEFESKARSLNRLGKGDQAFFILKKAN